MIQSHTLIHFFKRFLSAMHLSRSAVTCAVTAVICVLAGSGLGLFSTMRHQIVFAMITGVCFFASGTCKKIDLIRNTLN